MKKKIAVTFPIFKSFGGAELVSLEICDLCILDVENESQYLSEIEDKITKKKKANYNLNIFFKDRQDWFKLLTERPFMKDYFPGYEKYIWMDADTEVLSSDGIVNLINACEDKELAIAPEISESYVFKNSKFTLIFFHFLLLVD